MQHPDPTPPSCESPLPERLLLRLADLPKLFTRPTWQNVLLLVAGAILAPGKRTVTAALRILGRERETDFPIYHGVLNKAVWSSRAVAGWLLRLLVGTFLSADATVVIGIDDTIERSWGQKISARGIYRDPVRSSKGHFVKTSGLRWLSAQLLVHIPWAGRIMGLPFLTVLARLHCRSTAGCQAAGLSSSATLRSPPSTSSVPSEIMSASSPDCASTPISMLPHRLDDRAADDRRSRACPCEGGGQAPAHTDASAARCRHKLAAPYCHPLVRPHQSCH
jgi:hypothetical protein